MGLEVCIPEHVVELKLKGELRHKEMHAVKDQGHFDVVHETVQKLDFVELIDLVGEFEHFISELGLSEVEQILALYETQVRGGWLYHN